VADPDGIVMTFLDRKYEKLLRLDSITCLIDAEAVFTHGDDQELSTLKMRQIAYADMVILNKVDLVGLDHIEVIHEWIGHYLQRIRIVEASHCDIPLEILMAVGRFDPARLSQEYLATGSSSQHAPHHHGTARQSFATWSYETDRPFDLRSLQEMVRRELPETIYRCKGIIQIEGKPDKRFALQAVGRRTEVTELGDWNGQQPSSRIVAIGSRIDGGELTSRFDACVAQQGSM